MSPFIVLGLDLALGHTGWAHVAYEDGTLLASGVIAPDAGLELHERLIHIADAVHDVLTESVMTVAIERAVSHRSGTTTIRLGMVHGAVLVALHNGPGFIDVGPTEVKKWATGNGAADKDAMVAAAHTRFGRKLTADEADAALVAAWARDRLLAADAVHPSGGGVA